MVRLRHRKQANEDSPEWKMLRQLLPDALNSVLPDQLTYLAALPIARLTSAQSGDDHPPGIWIDVNTPR